MKKIILLDSFQNLNTEKICKEIIFRLNQGERVVLDFNNITDINFSKLEFLIIETLKSAKYHKIKNRLSFKNAHPQIRSLIYHIIDKYKKNFI